MKQIDILVDRYLQEGYVSQDEAPWLRYALEKRIITLITFVPLLILGFSIANPATVIGFFIAFCSLRARTNGFHAKSVGRCLLYSVLGELLFFKILPSVWNDITVDFGSTAVAVGGTKTLAGVSLSGTVKSTTANSSDSVTGKMYTKGSVWTHVRDTATATNNGSKSLYWANSDGDTGTFWAQCQAAGSNHSGYCTVTQTT